MRPSVLSGGRVARSVPMSGVVLVAAGAALWGTDALFRRGLALRLPAVEVVFWEHLLLAAVAVPLLAGAGARLRALAAGNWLALAVIGGGSSVAATVLFTEAFRHGDPTTPLLLQKLQPVFAAGAAHLLLGERVRCRYAVYLVLALAGSYLVALRNPAEVSVSALMPAVLGAGAALLWALGTVLGKREGMMLTSSQLAAMRFILGLPVTVLLLLALSPSAGVVQAQPGDAPALIAVAVVPGLAALLVYYAGLRRTTASAATLAELAFPLTALVVNAIAFGTTLTGTQATGLVLLACTVGALAHADRRGSRAVGVEPGAAFT